MTTDKQELPELTPCWYVKDFADGWIKFYDIDCAIAEAKETGAIMRYSDDGSYPKSYAQGRTQNEAPEGWKLVPIEPTQEMIDAAEKHDEDGYNHQDIPIVHHADCERHYEAMLSAAPPVPIEKVDGLAEAVNFKWRYVREAVSGWNWEDRGEGKAGGLPLHIIEKLRTAARLQLQRQGD